MLRSLLELVIPLKLTTPGEFAQAIFDKLSGVISAKFHFESTCNVFPPAAVVVAYGPSQKKFMLPQHSTFPQPLTPAKRQLTSYSLLKTLAKELSPSSTNFNDVSQKDCTTKHPHFSSTPLYIHLRLEASCGVKLTSPKTLDQSLHQLQNKSLLSHELTVSYLIHRLLKFLCSGFFLACYY